MVWGPSNSRCTGERNTLQGKRGGGGGGGGGGVEGRIEWQVHGRENKFVRGWWEGEGGEGGEGRRS
jgi:hypothetical protein